MRCLAWSATWALSLLTGRPGRQRIRLHYSVEIVRPADPRGIARTSNLLLTPGAGTASPSWWPRGLDGSGRPGVHSGREGPMVGGTRRTPLRGRDDELAAI